MKRLLLTLIPVISAALLQAQTIYLHIDKKDVSCYGDSTGYAAVSTAGDTADTYYYYRWSNHSTFNTLGYVPAGTYSVTVTGGITSATAAGSITINQPSSAVTVSASATAASTCTAYDGTASATASGGTGAYTYPWSNGQAGANISGLHADVYQVTATDANGCTASASANVSSPANFTLSFSTIKTSCYGAQDGEASVISVGDSTATFTWSNNDSGDTIPYLFAGNYTVTAINARGCSVAASVTLNQPAPIQITLTPSSSQCGRTTGAVSAGVTGNTGSITYDWSTGATTSAISSLGAGIYRLTVTSDNCMADDSTVVNNSNGPVVSLTAFNPSCFNASDGAIYATVTGGTPPYTYLWVPDGGLGDSMTGLTGNSYTLTVTDAAHCEGEGQAYLAQPDYVNANTYIYNVACNGDQNGSITVGSSGGTPPYTYLWSNNDSSSYNGNLTAGLTYSFTVSDAHGCQTTSQAGVLQPGVLVVSFDTVGSSGLNGSAYANVSGGNYPYTFSWSNFENGQTDTALAPGPYSVTVIDSKGCSATGTTTVLMVSAINQADKGIWDAGVFPNPAQNSIYIVANEDMNTALFTLTDISGQPVYTAQQTLPSGARAGIDVSYLAPGLYLLDITGDGKQYRAKVVVAR